MVNVGRSTRDWITRHAVLLIIVAVVAFPVAFIVISSFRPTFYPVRIIPEEVTLMNYRVLFQNTPFLRWMGISVLIGGASAALTLIFVTPAAYAFSRLDFTGKKHILFLIILTQIFPLLMGMIAVYKLFFVLGITGAPEAYYGLILLYAGGNVPFYTWFLKGHIDSIPRSIDEAARLDGSSRFKIFIKMIIPISKPTLGTIFFLSFIFPYNDPVFPSIMINDSNNYTLVVGIWQTFVGGRAAPVGTSPWCVVSAAVLIGAIPVATIFLLFQKYIIEAQTE